MVKEGSKSKTQTRTWQQEALTPHLVCARAESTHRRGFEVLTHTGRLPNFQISTSFMRSVLAAAILLTAVLPKAAASIFTVQPGTVFYSKPKQAEQYVLELPEVRVNVPPLQDSGGFCRFELIYKIADRTNSSLPKTAWARCVSIDSLVP